MCSAFQTLITTTIILLMDKTAQPLTIALLHAFPLPRTLEVLPPHVLQDFSRQYDLVKGYIKQLDAYTQTETNLRNIIHEQISTINKIIGLLDAYEKNSSAIASAISKMNELYKEFLNYETYQYQLLSSNFNQNFLKLKFSKLTSASDEESMNAVKEYRNSGDLLLTFLQDFRQKRKLYHLLKEKLNRWDEERISGLI